MTTPVDCRASRAAWRSMSLGLSNSTPSKPSDLRSWNFSSTVPSVVTMLNFTALRNLGAASFAKDRSPITATAAAAAASFPNSRRWIEYFMAVTSMRKGSSEERHRPTHSTAPQLHPSQARVVGHLAFLLMGSTDTMSMESSDIGYLSAPAFNRCIHRRKVGGELSMKVKNLLERESPCPN